jgi:hypothetical protein
MTKSKCDAERDKCRQRRCGKYTKSMRKKICEWDCRRRHIWKNPAGTNTAGEKNKGYCTGVSNPSGAEDPPVQEGRRGDRRREGRREAGGEKRIGQASRRADKPPATRDSGPAEAEAEAVAEAVAEAEREGEAERHYWYLQILEKDLKNFTPDDAERAPLISPDRPEWRGGWFSYFDEHNCTNQDECRKEYVREKTRAWSEWDFIDDISTIMSSHNIHRYSNLPPDLQERVKYIDGVWASTDYGDYSEEREAQRQARK